MTISAAGLWAVSGWWGGLQQVTVVLSLPETGAEARRGSSQYFQIWSLLRLARSRSCLPWLGFTGCNLGPHFTSLVQINNTRRQIDIVFRFPLAQIAQSINFLPLVVKRRMDSMWNWFFSTNCLFLLHIAWLQRAAPTFPLSDQINHKQQRFVKHEKEANNWWLIALIKIHVGNVN